jgi:hypothetical protein
LCWYSCGYWYHCEHQRRKYYCDNFLIHFLPPCFFTTNT